MHIAIVSTPNPVTYQNTHVNFFFIFQIGGIFMRFNLSKSQIDISSVIAF